MKATNSQQSNEIPESELPEQAPESENSEQPTQTETSEQTPEPEAGFLPRAKKIGLAVWEYIKTARIELIVLVALLALDLITKGIVASAMTEGESIRLIPEFLYITFVKNDKAAFGSAFGMEKFLSLEAIRIIFLIVTIIAVGVFFYLMVRCRRRHILMRLAFSLIISGALGNFFDRLVLHYVRDFIHIHFFGCSVPLLGTDFPVFNVADMALTVGVILFIVYFIALYHEPKPEPETEAAEEEGETSADAQDENTQEENTDAQEDSENSVDIMDPAATSEEKDE